MKNSKIVKIHDEPQLVFETRLFILTMEDPISAIYFVLVKVIHKKRCSMLHSCFYG